MKNAVFSDVMTCGSYKNRRFGELSASFIRVTRTGELGTTLAVTSNRRTMRPPKRRFLQDPHDVTSQKTPFFIVTVVKTSNLTWHNLNYGKQSRRGPDIFAVSQLVMGIIGLYS
jgi:hypothetical protein